MDKPLSIHYLLFGAGIFLLASCSPNIPNSPAEADSLATAAQANTPSQTQTVVLVAGNLEIGLPEGLKKGEVKSGTAVDSLFFEVEMGVNPMDLEFSVLKHTDENLSLEQLEEQKLYVGDEGKTFEHASGKTYRSKWYTLPYALEHKFRLTSYKDDDDYSNLVEAMEASGQAGLSGNQTLSAYTNRYYLRFKTSVGGNAKEFVWVLEIPVGC